MWVEATFSPWSGPSDYLGPILAPPLRSWPDPIEFVWFRATADPGLFEGVLGSVHYSESPSMSNGDFGAGLTQWHTDLVGNAQANVIDWETGPVLQLVSGSPARVWQDITTPAVGMRLYFDFNFQTVEGQLSVMLGDTLLATLTAEADMQNGMTSHCLEVTDPALLGVDSIALRFHFDGPSASTVLLDNIAFVEVPEPATLSLLGLGGVGLVRYRRQLHGGQ